MKLEIAKAIAESAQQIDLDVRLRESYSGRCMYGTTTAGLVGSKTNIVKAIAYTAWRFGGEDLELPESMDIDDFLAELDLRWDSMGYDNIAY
jgi:hypothetical protein